ncbi:putative protein OS=Tsukamurella paurometabola (strain ATCC 8368 / DSM / CCUG 35730 /CIP 100753 / JCM 10117 / KCTC 9821 / NBRC 16120 / NCIMB 702349/ NCTC 13040) OX=521096 GN=Tpau_1916 PE=4 SV=1 [Tsukamurella paurometabola]|uniref:Uncharacterized protein n=1 Tax=Tsukamurella paurometabola (strain ATCC 8368 / DSM 20162 / CCUG 35730 / CIP 100753 / JCM 10117 / KCTC 9821 / NBRC 16120 / NCIMB 702349 / NCTC 13040) TaxID=521096 RepID=D5UN32_TSUPD|nr:hypothetical protein [Tsukamurella paurometabola]ADG78529.1 conserved hypothetical protein [Tsukamurella paurometabola DSM 20162]SUP32048.1 Uncharacterised protein [Tsukamurella paurometabola]
MFTSEERQGIANRLIGSAQDSEDFVAGAVVGAAAIGMLDDVTGIDLQFAAAPGAAIEDVRERLVRTLYRDFGAIHHTVENGTPVFLLPNLLTARIAVVPADLFGPRAGEPFQQLFGVTDPQPTLEVGTVDLIGPAWLGALRTRAALRRGDGPGAAAQLDPLRDALIALIGARTGAPAGYLPRQERDTIQATFPSSVSFIEVERAFGVAVQILDHELQSTAPVIGDAVALPLLEEVAD